MPAASLARELAEAYARRQIVEPPSAQFPGFTLSDAYAVEAELVRLRRAAGHAPVGRKVGFANRSLWRVFKLDTVLWAHLYDDTVRYAGSGETAPLSLGRMLAPKLEPEIVFKLSRAPSGPLSNPATVLESVEWLALGYEIVDCVYPDWRFQPADFVAAFGLHAALIVGPPLQVSPDRSAALAGQLATCRVRLLRDGELVAEGGGEKVLQSPALCVGELAAGLTRQGSAEPLAAGELIASGALCDNQFIAPGQRWTAGIEGLALPDLSLQTSA